MLLITGANGQLGTCLRDILPAQEYIATDVNELDITNEKAVLSFGDTHQLSAIVNCAAYTQVDNAENAPALVRQLNAVGPANLAKLASSQQIPLIHISTDYVFDGTANAPIAENAPARPLGMYGQTKWEGEKAVFRYAQTAVILRTAWLYSPYGKNFLKTMLKLGQERSQLRVVADQFGTPTYAPHLARAIVDILPHIKPGTQEIYHFTDEGSATWYDFATYILKCAKSPCEVLPILTKDYPTPARRPAFSVLDKTKFKTTFNKRLSHWTQGVEECLSKLS